MSATIEAVAGRSSDLTAEYTQKLDAFVNDLVPPMLSNAEYAARTSALMIALNRELARCAAAFGSAHQVDADTMIQLVTGQFNNNYFRANSAVVRQGTA